MASPFDGWVQRGLFLGCTGFSLCEMGLLCLPSSDTQLECNVGKEYLPKSQNEITPRVKHNHIDLKESCKQQGELVENGNSSRQALNHHVSVETAGESVLATSEKGSNHH